MLVDTQKLVDSWENYHLNAGRPPIYACFFCYFLRFSFLFSGFDRKKLKNCFNAEKILSASEWQVKHLFAGQNTQHPMQEYNHKNNKNFRKNNVHSRNTPRNRTYGNSRQFSYQVGNADYGTENRQLSRQGARTESVGNWQHQK